MALDGGCQQSSPVPALSAAAHQQASEPPIDVVGKTRPPRTDACSPALQGAPAPVHPAMMAMHRVHALSPVRQGIGQPLPDRRRRDQQQGDHDGRHAVEMPGKNPFREHRDAPATGCAAVPTRPAHRQRGADPAGHQGPDQHQPQPDPVPVQHHPPEPVGGLLAPRTSTGTRFFHAGELLRPPRKGHISTPLDTVHLLFVTTQHGAGHPGRQARSSAPPVSGTALMVDSTASYPAPFPPLTLRERQACWSRALPPKDLTGHDLGTT